MTYDDPILSNTSVGGKRLTWRELVELQEEELTRLRAFANLVSDLDRCRHAWDADDNEVPIICAAVRSVDEDAARAQVCGAYNTPPAPHDVKWRFCEPLDQPRSVAASRRPSGWHGTTTAAPVHAPTMMDDDDLGSWLVFVLGLAVLSVLAVGLVVWAGWRDETGIDRASTTIEVSPEATEAPDRVETPGTSVSVPGENAPGDGWPADWPTRHEIALHAWAAHLAGLSHTYSTPVRVEQPAHNPAEGSVADEAIRSIICDGRAWDCPTALRVVECESTFDAGAVGGKGERGWWQIHPVHAPALGETWGELFDPVVNTEVAYEMWSEQGWRPWTCARGRG